MALQACGLASGVTAPAESLRRDSRLRAPASSSVSASRGCALSGKPLSRTQITATRTARNGSARRGVTVCGLDDFIGGDLIGLDLGQWVDDVEKFGSIGFYAPPEGGAECRYATALKYKGYHFMNVSARGLGDPEAYLLKPHGVRPAHLGKQAVARFYMPGEVDYRLSILPPRYKGIVVWVGEAKVLSRNELQFLALLPALRPGVKVVCEMGGSRKLFWKPMKELVGLPATPAAATAASAPLPTENQAAKVPVSS